MYEGFIRNNSKNGKYDPEKGENSLLSSLTPDPKAIALLFMEDGKWYYTSKKLYKDILYELRRVGAGGKFPVTMSGIWSYYEFISNEEMVPGSLVNTGLVDQKKEFVVWFPPIRELSEGLFSIRELGKEDCAYRISDAGIELARPLILKATEFVYKARRSNIPHRYDSMWRIFGSVHSPTERKRPIAVSKLLRFLVENEDEYGVTDLMLMFEESIGEKLGLIINSLGHSGLIYFESPRKDVKRRKGYSTYSLNRIEELERPIDEIYEKVKKIAPYFSAKGYLSKVLDYIRENPAEIFERNELSERLRIDRSSASKCLSLLEMIGILKRESGFKGRKILSRVKANDLTKMLYDYVLAPAHELAETLNPNTIGIVEVDGRYIREFLDNYQEERTMIGRGGGRGIREFISNFLANRDESELSEIVNEGNNAFGIDLSTKAYLRQLKNLIEQGKVERVRRGYYRLKRKKR
ncbi:MAG: hypothetical protein QXM11_01080 [Candidatus Aenigmatarchaeota archaeon]